MNTHETYVSLEVAKLLKQAGFDWKEYLKPLSVYDGGGSIWKIPLHIAQKWLREVKHFQIEPKYYPSSLNSYKYGWMWHMFIVNPPYVYKYVDGDGFFDTYEEAQEAGEKVALEMILEK